jgi:ketosteroid isomerase-like protein
MKQEITKQLKAYEDALNTSDTKAAMALYGKDPIFMAEYAKAFIGRDAVRQGYGRVFQTIKLNVIFTIHEIVDMGGDLAYARTTSAGKQEMLATHKMSQEANNELFIFRKEKGAWKIHRYLFASCNPPPMA